MEGSPRPDHEPGWWPAESQDWGRRRRPTWKTLGNLLGTELGTEGPDGPQFWAPLHVLVNTAKPHRTRLSALGASCQQGFWRTRRSSSTPPDGCCPAAAEAAAPPSHHSTTDGRRPAWKAGRWGGRAPPARTEASAAPPALRSAAVRGREALAPCRERGGRAPPARRSGHAPYPVISPSRTRKSCATLETDSPFSSTRSFICCILASVMRPASSSSTFSTSGCALRLLMRTT